MAKKLYEEEDIREIACAIREKCGDETAKYKCCDMPAAIRNLTIGSTAVIEPLEITANGTYAAADGVDGYSPITVNVPMTTDTEDAIVSGKMELIPGVAEAPYQYNNLTAPGVRSHFMEGNDTIRSVSFSSAEFIGDNAFKDCLELRGAFFPAATTIGNWAFSLCYQFYAYSFPLVKEIGNYAFDHCNLNSFDFPDVEHIGTGAFQSGLIVDKLNCSAYKMEDQAFRSCNITIADLSSAYEIGLGAFYGVSELKALALRYANQCELKSPYFESTSAALEYIDKYPENDPLHKTAIANGNGYIYVRASMVDRYKADTYWKKYADRIRALEDYTVDGTYYGDLDESKI